MRSMNFVLYLVLAMFSLSNAGVIIPDLSFKILMDNINMSRPTQSVAVKGVVLCNSLPVMNVLVKLYDHDTFTLDDLMAKGQSDPHGKFLLTGKAHEITRITPKLNIYHDCNDGIKLCQRKLSIEVPKEFITRGSDQPNQVYDIGTVELAIKFGGETRDCLHKK